MDENKYIDTIQYYLNGDFLKIVKLLLDLLGKNIFKSINRIQAPHSNSK